MKKQSLIRTIFLAGSLLLQLNILCFQSRGAAGDVDLSFDPGSGVNGTVNAVAVQPDGKVIIGGDFTTVKGLLRTNLARLNADGSGDGNFTAGYLVGEVHSIAIQSDGKVLVGHEDGIKRLNSDGSWDTSFWTITIVYVDEEGSLYPHPGAVSSIVVQLDGKVLIGGEFTEVNGVHRSGIARLNANGILDSTFNPGTGVDIGVGANSGVLAIIQQPDNRVLIGGFFQAVNGTNRQGIARLNANGSLDATFNPDTENSKVFSIALQPDGKVFVGGYISTLNGANSGIVRLDANGSLDPSFSPPLGTNATVRTIAWQSDGGVLIGGHFATVQGTNRQDIARLQSNGTLDSSFGFNPPGSFYISSIVLQSNGCVLVAGRGNFGVVNGASRKNVARLNADGGLDDSFDPGTSVTDIWQAAEVRSVVLQADAKVLTGGHFPGSDNVRNCGIVRLEASGSLDASFNPGIGRGANIQSVALQADGNVLIGGRFTTVNAPNGRTVARLYSNGSLNTAFNPNFGVIVNPGDYVTHSAFAVQTNGQVFVAGSRVQMECDQFDDCFWSYLPFFVHLNGDGSVDSTFNPDIGSFFVSSMALQTDGKVVLGLEGYDATNGSTNAIVRLLSNGTPDTSFNAAVNASAYSITLQPDGKVLIGGTFTTVNGTNRNRIARLNTDGSLDGSFSPGTGADSWVSSAVVQPDGKVLIGGYFTTVNGTSRNRIARLNANGSLDSTFNPGTGANGPVYSIALQPDGNVLIGGNFLTVNGVLRQSVARLYGDFIAPSPSLHIARSNAFVIVSWPANATRYLLQESTNHSLGNWLPVAQSTVTNAGQIAVTVPTTGTRFFRLKSP